MPAEVQFLLGRAGAGKTHHIFEQLRGAMEHGRRAVLIVPEQFTYETERALSARLGGLLGIQVLSFERLAERATGVQDRPFISPQGRRMVMRRVAYRHRKELRAFGAIAHRAGFAAKMDSLYVRCKRYMIEPEALRAAGRASAGRAGGEQSLSLKLQDMALLFSAAQEYLQQSYIDMEDGLNAFLQSLPHSFLRGAEVYMDGFDILTAQMAAILRGMMQYCAKLTVSFCLDPDARARDAQLFAPERQAFERLREQAFALGCACHEHALTPHAPHAPHEPHARHAELIHLERNLFAQPVAEYAKAPSSIRLVGAANREEEVEAAAEALLELVRGGMRYREIAVVAADLPAYAALVQRAFSLRGIPLFYDAGRGLQGRPVVELLLGAARVAVSGVTSADLVRIAKTGLSGVAHAEAEALENYALARGIRGGKRFQEAFAEEEEEAESARARLMPPLLRLREAFASAENASAMTRALYRYLEELEVREQIEAAVEELEQAGRLALVEEISQVWEILMELFSQLDAILGSVRMSRREFYDVLHEALAAYQVGMIPVTADQVLFGDISRTRSKEVRALFVLGCNEGLFPRPRQDDDLLDDAELSELQELGLAPWEDTLALTKGDRLALYRALNKAAERISFSFAYADGSRELVPSSVLDQLGAAFPKLAETAAGFLEAGALPQSERGGFSLLARNLRQKEQPLHAALYAYYKDNAAYAPRLARAEAFSKQPGAPESFGQPLARKLYGKRLYTSVSRLETFQSCPFRHFAAYGLLARPRPEFREAQSDIGSFSHAALDAFFAEAAARGLAFSEITEQQANEILDAVLPACVQSYRDGLLCATARTRMLSGFWMEAVRQTALSVCRSFAGGGFLPERTEAVFGQEGALPAVDCGVAVLSGKIDRVDVAPLVSSAEAQAGGDGQLVRVVDYKTGGTDWNYGRIADGQDMQLPVYLYAATRAEGAVPAGMYLQPVKDVPEDEAGPEEARKSLRPTGLLRNDQAALTATAREEDARRQAAKSTLLEPGQLEALLAYSVRRAKAIAVDILQGRVAAAPVYRGRGTTCSYCEYKGVCRFDPKLPQCRVRKSKPYSREEFFRMLEEGGGE